MAPTETILISSSPRARTPPLALSPSPGAIQAMRSSSPGLPSPSTLFRPSDFRSGSCLAQSPKHAPLGFATASSIYQREQLQVKGDGRNKTAKAPEINGTEQLAVLENSRTGKPVKLRKPAITTNKEPRSKRGAVSVGAQGKSSATVEDQTTRIIQDSDAESIFEVPARKPSLDLSEYAFAAPTTNFTPDKAASPRKTVVKGKRAKKPSIDEHAPCKAPRSGSKAAHASVIEPTTNTDNKLAEDQIGNPTVEDSQFNGQSSKPSKRANPRVARDKAQKEPKPKKKRPKKSTSGEESRPEVPHDSFQEAAAVPTFKALSASIQESQTLAGEQYVGHSRDPTTSSEDIGLDRAPRRRLSWTPAKDTGLPTSFQERSSSVPITPPAKATFENLLGDFGYQQEHPIPALRVERDITGQAPTKRRRVEVVKVGAHDDAAPPIETKAPKQPTKRAPAPKKPPVTITALATSAYKAQQPGEQEKGTISAFFSPQPRSGNRGEAASIREIVRLSKPKMARKSRAKAGTSDAADGKGVKKPKGKGKAKPTTESVVEELYLPERALREMQQQDFLFATSSQLAREESPAFLRDLQQAMKESEAMTSSQMAGPLDATSCVIVPSAPHGTCLSIGQANRGHWRASARDFDQGTLAPDEAVFLPQGEPLAMTQIPLVQYDEPDGFCERQTPEPVPGLDPRDKEKTTSDSVFHRRDLRIDHDDESQDSGFIDIDDTGKDAENTWKTLAVDEPLQTASASRSMPRVSASQTTFQRNAPLLSHPAPDSNTGTMQRQRTVSPQRLPLQPLDANVDVLKSIHSVNPKSASTARNIASTTSKSLTTGCGNNPQNEPVSPIKKSRGRPRKGPVAPDPTAPPKRRGRPPKTQPLPEPPVQPLKSKTAPSPPEDQSEWRLIDDIIDPDPIPSPSPPRRSASLAQQIQILELTPAPAAAAPTKPPSRASKLSRSDPSTYASAFLTLFPQITRTIKSAPPTTDLSNPSWNEKILLYDPIVLEDLTEWLHAQGLVVEISRSKKPLGRGKGRGTKNTSDDAVEGADEAADDAGDAEMEVVKEDLKPWVVQKWCEENSVCCLWKEGLRGGVRQRY